MSAVMLALSRQVCIAASMERKCTLNGDYEATRGDPNPAPALSRALEIATFDPGMYEITGVFFRTNSAESPCGLTHAATEILTSLARGRVHIVKTETPESLQSPWKTGSRFSMRAFRPSWKSLVL
jgi:hypothetical protein